MGALPLVWGGRRGRLPPEVLLIKRAAPASLGPDAVLALLLVVCKVVRSLLAGLIKGEPGVEKPGSEIDGLFFDVKRLRFSYVECREVLIVQGIDAVAKPPDCAKHTIEVLEALLLELRGFALVIHRGILWTSSLGGWLRRGVVVVVLWSWKCGVAKDTARIRSTVLLFKVSATSGRELMMLDASG